MYVVKATHEWKNTFWVAKNFHIGITPERAQSFQTIDEAHIFARQARAEYKQSGDKVRLQFKYEPELL